MKAQKAIITGAALGTAGLIAYGMYHWYSAEADLLAAAARKAQAGDDWVRAQEFADKMKKAKHKGIGAAIGVVVATVVATILLPGIGTAIAGSLAGTIGGTAAAAAGTVVGSAAGAVGGAIGSRVGAAVGEKTA